MVKVVSAALLHCHRLL